jgi:PAS domain S-box-containing protein
MSEELPEVVQMPRDDLSEQQIGAIARAILEAAVDAIIVISPIGAILSANEATVKLFGWEQEQMVGRNVSMLMPEPYRSEHDHYLERYLATGAAHIIGIGREVEAQRADGTIFPMSLSVSEVKTGELHLFTGIIHDLTERNRQRDALERANEELEMRVAERTRELDESLEELQRSNRDLDQFASVASHDLKTPLRNVRQALELLEEHLTGGLGVEFDDEATELRNFTFDAATRMEDLIDGLLAYARVQGASVDDVVDLGDVVAGVVAAVHLDLEELDATLDIAELPMVVGSGVQLRQVFFNLVGNAIRYRSPERTLALAIEVEELGERVQVTLRDNGVGIDEDHHGRIFELFRRVQKTSEGVGLGLAICQRVIEAHGGTIRVESEPGAGSAFIFDLPLAAGSASL